MSDILNKILDVKADEVAAAKKHQDTASLRREVESDRESRAAIRGFEASLRAKIAAGKAGVIAEIKKASPSKGLIREDFDPPVLAQAYEAGGAACLSVLTDGPSFQGADDYLVAARAATALPCIRKDFLVDPWQVAESRALGADAILVILAMIDDVLAAELMAEARRLGMDALVEVHDEAEMARAGALGADLVGINNRDLKSFVVDLAVTERLSAQAPSDALLVTESGIFTHQDVVRMEATGVKAMLVGESLMRHADVTAATRTLIG